MCYIAHRTREAEMIILPDIHKSTLRVYQILQTLVYVIKGDMTYVNA